MLLAACGGNGAGDGPGFAFETPEDLGVAHLAPAEVDAILAGTQAAPDYSSIPATSGIHAPTWALCGIYREEVPEIFTVHSLEHGAIIVYYRPGDVEESVLTEVEDLARTMSTHIVVMPLAGMEEPVALVAWGHLARRQGLDADEVRKFWAEFAQRGPEPGIACRLDVDQAA